MIFEWDDFGCNHIISDMCQSHDCRKVLEQLKALNPAFKCTLFAIPAEMTQELLTWSRLNLEWVELAVHGFYHSSNYECEKMTFQEFEENMEFFYDMISDYFVRGFRAPGWQISDDIYKWLDDSGWWVADQGYNDERRPKTLKAYVNYDNNFQSVNTTYPTSVEAYHGHTWDVGWNGIYEDIEKVEGLVKAAQEFRFVSELF